MQKELDFSCNVVGFDLDDSGVCTGLITDNCFTLQIYDENGNSVALDKEKLEKIFRGEYE